MVCYCVYKFVICTTLSTAAHSMLHRTAQTNRVPCTMYSVCAEQFEQCLYSCELLVTNVNVTAAHTAVLATTVRTLQNLMFAL
jgi:hypothetical protein